MSLLEVTLSIGIALAIAAAAVTQIAMQSTMLLHYRDVDYYSREVPRTVAAVQNMSRGAHTFRIAQVIPPRSPGVGGRFEGVSGPPTGDAAFRPGGGRAGVGNALYMMGTHGGTNSQEAVIWLSDNSSRTTREGNSIADPVTMERTFPENNMDICLAVRTNGGTWGGGWILNKQVSGLQFDIIPDSGGATLMTVLKRMRGEARPGIAYQLVLERR